MIYEQELGYGDSDGADSDTADTILDLSLSPSMINAYSQLTCVSNHIDFCMTVVYNNSKNDKT
jgi:hypothetical protein